MYHDAVKREIGQGEFKAVRIAGLDLERQSYIVYLKEKSLSVVAQEFLSLLRASAKDPPQKITTAQNSKGQHNSGAGNYILPSRLRN
jgi:hypothetical protein